MINNQTCFIVCPIGRENTDTRKNSDRVFEYIIKPVLDKLGYTPLRADQISEPGMITSQVIDLLTESPLVIADLSDNNPNVFYELAIRHITQKPYVQIIKNNQKIPFDVNGMRTINYSLEIDEVERVRARLDEQIRSVNKNFNASNPITLAKSYALIKNLLMNDAHIKEVGLSKATFEVLNEMRVSMTEIKNDMNIVKSNILQKRGGTTLSGRVTVRNTGIGVGGAHVVLIDMETKEEFYKTMADAYGNYVICNIWSNIKPYQLHAYKTPYGEAFTESFIIEPGEYGVKDIHLDTDMRILGYDTPEG